MSSMELGDRLIHVRGTVKHEKDFPSFTQVDVTCCMPCLVSMWSQENVPQRYAVIQCRTEKVMLDLLGPYCENRIEYVLLKCLERMTVLLLCVYCVLAHIVVILCIVVVRAFSCPVRQE